MSRPEDKANRTYATGWNHRHKVADETFTGDADDCPFCHPEKRGDPKAKTERAPYTWDGW